MNSLPLIAIETLARMTTKRALARDHDLLRLRSMMKVAARLTRSPPRDVRVSRTVLGGVPTEVLSPACEVPGLVILYLHGGGFVAGSADTHRPITWRLASLARAKVFVPEYRLAPEHPFPAGPDDVFASYLALLASGVGSSEIVAMGDSAGGNLALGLVHAARARSTPTPAALVALSATTELARDLPSHTANAELDALFPDGLRERLLAGYCPDHDPEDVRVSPMHGRFEGFPRVLLQVARDERLHDDSVDLARRMRACDVEVSLDIWPHALHVFQFFADVVPEARVALERVASFARASVSA